jgi:hypothetical protein
MKWIYILKCEDDYYYIGQTSRLCRRFWEHNDGRGGINTSIYKPIEIVAIYKVDIICKFLDYNEYLNNIINDLTDDRYKKSKIKYFNDDNEYDEINKNDNLYAENNIIECLMLNNKDKWDKFRGGKYVRLDIKYKYPENNNIKELPLCKCKLPCDIRKNDDKDYLYFRCAKKNMWEKLRDEFDIDNKPCNFYMEYIKDKQLKIEEDIKFKDRCNTIKKLYKKSYWLKNVEINNENYPNQCVGGCNRTTKSIKLSYNFKKINLCFDCFIDKNDELSKIYKENKNNVYLFSGKTNNIEDEEFNINKLNVCLFSEETNNIEK